MEIELFFRSCTVLCIQGYCQEKGEKVPVNKEKVMPGENWEAKESIHEGAGLKLNLE